mgnify:CR=1 FL=1
MAPHHIQVLRWPSARAGSLKVLVFGAAGQLGQALLERAPIAGHLAIGLSRAQVDITDAQAVSAAIRACAPDAVINTAAFTAVDAAEDDREAAFRVNADGAQHIASICGAMGVPMCYISSDYVFDGSSQVPYREDDPINPLSVYGASKAEGETRVRNATSRHLIIRTSWVFGHFGKNFVKAILGRLGTTELLRVIDDQVGCPTAAEDLAPALFEMLEAANRTGAWGTYHFCGREAVSWFEFAEAIALAKHSRVPDTTEIVRTPTAAYGQRAVRPAYSVLDCQRIIAKLGINVPAWPAALANVVDHWVAEGN